MYTYLKCYIMFSVVIFLYNLQKTIQDLDKFKIFVNTSFWGLKSLATKLLLGRFSPNGGIIGLSQTNGQLCCLRGFYDNHNIVTVIFIACVVLLQFNMLFMTSVFLCVR